MSANLENYVLVVDDDPSVQVIASEALARMGLQGRSAASGEEALRIVRDHPPRMILLDVSMGGMAGLVTLTRLQESRSTRRIPIILLSQLSENLHHMRRLPGVVAAMYKGDFSVAQLCDVLGWVCTALN